MNLPDGYIARPATWADLDAVVEVFRACDLADVGFAEPAREHVRDDWRLPTFDLDRDSRVVLAGEAMVAYVSVGGLNPSISLEVFGRVHPEHRSRGLGDALLAWGEAHARSLVPAVPVVRTSVPAEDPSARALLERHGFVAARTFWHMTRDLGAPVEPVAEPEGVRIRRYEHEADVRPVYDALEEAFAEHWAFEPYPYEVHERDLLETDARLIAVGVADGSVVGAAIARTVDTEGWVDVVGVRAPWRGRGIARALLLRVFGGLAELGARSASLSVDAENATGAPRLYAAAGMQVRRAWTAFEKRSADPVG